MTEIVLHSPPQFPSSPRLHPHNDGPHQQPLFISSSSYSVSVCRGDTGEEVVEGSGERKASEKEEGDQLSLLAALLTAFRKSSLLIACRSSSGEKFSSSASSSMEIGLPTDVRHVAHVTFDRFNGFLGLPVEFEPEIPRRPPSASTRVFGVSTESMQLSFDSRGNSVPTILLMMQRRLYEQGGLQAEGIFRITAGNSQEEFVREQLNSGVVPGNIDVHCLAGLIKAWFRELPNGILDSLPSEDVMQSQSEEECAELMRRLPPTETALLDWAINLMADVAQMETHNKMNARNIAMVFAPNMTQMADPLTALMYAVQVMNFLKTLIEKRLRERAEYVIERSHPFRMEPYDDNGPHASVQQLFLEAIDEVNEEDEHIFSTNEPSPESPSHHHVADDAKLDTAPRTSLTSIENIIPGGRARSVGKLPEEIANEALIDMLEESDGSSHSSKGSRHKMKGGQTSRSNLKRVPKKGREQATVRSVIGVEKRKGTSIISRLNPASERVEAWR